MPSWSQIIIDVTLLCSGTTPLPVQEIQCRQEVLTCIQELRFLEHPAVYDNTLEVCIESWEIRLWEKNH